MRHFEPAAEAKILWALPNMPVLLGLKTFTLQSSLKEIYSHDWIQHKCSTKSWQLWIIHIFCCYLVLRGRQFVLAMYKTLRELPGKKLSHHDMRVSLVDFHFGSPAIVISLGSWDELTTLELFPWEGIKDSRSKHNYYNLLLSYSIILWPPLLLA